MTDTAENQGASCAFCLAAIDRQNPSVECPACRAAYHLECWEENGGCGVYGCSRGPAVENRRAIEVPISYWGQENKPCPACAREILAAAVRCRHCGATFGSAKPEDAVAFQTRRRLDESLPAARRTVVWIFVASVVPFLAPVGAAWGIWWQRTNRESLRALPAMYGALARIGLIVSIGLTVALVVITGLYAGVRGR